MSLFISIANLSVKAVGVYFKQKETEQLSKIIKQNEGLMEFQKYQHIEQKKSILQQANRMLNDGLYSQNQSLRKELLNNAFMLYTQLISLPPMEKMPDETSFDNREFISKGYYGRFCYFGINSDFTNSTIQVYECAILYPEKAVCLFEPSFFPRIDCSQLSELCENLNHAIHYQPLIGLYKGIPENMAKPLIEMQIKKYIQQFHSILSSLKKIKPQ